MIIKLSYTQFFRAAQCFCLAMLFALPFNTQAETIQEAFRVLQGYQQQIIEIQQQQIPLRSDVDDLQSKIENEKVRNAEVIKEYRTARRELESARISGLPAALKNAQFNFMLSERRYEKSSGPLESYREKLKKTLATLSDNDAKISELETKIEQQNDRIAELNKKIKAATPTKTSTAGTTTTPGGTKALKESRIREKQAQGEVERLKNQLAEIQRTKFKSDPTAASRKHAIKEAMRMQLMMAQADPNDLRDDMTITVQKIGSEEPIELILKYKGSGQFVGELVLEVGEYRVSTYERVVKSSEGATEIKMELRSWTARIPPLDHKATHSFVYDTSQKPYEIRIYNNQFIKELGVF